MIIVFKTCLILNQRPTQRAPDLGYAPRFLSMFLACAESRSPALAPGASVEGDSTLPPQAGNASRWAADMTKQEFLRKNGIFSFFI